MTVTYAPSLRNLYVVPGITGSQSIRFDFSYKESAFDSEIGYFLVDDLQGRIGTLLPGQAGYVQAAMQRATTLFANTASAGATQTRTFNAGDRVAFYLIQDDTRTAFQAQNAANAATGDPLAFFSFTAANPDSVAHVQAIDDPLASQVLYGWEDMTGGGDRDYNDLAITARPQAATLSETIRVATAGNRDVSTVFRLQAPQRAVNGTGTPVSGEVGFFLVDDALGRIGGLLPGDRGLRRRGPGPATLLFAQGAAANTTNTLNLPGGGFLGFYFVPGGTARRLDQQPGQQPGDSPLAFFSFAAANPDSTVSTPVTHFRGFDPEGVAGTPRPPDEPFRLHLMGTPNGTATTSTTWCSRYKPVEARPPGIPNTDLCAETSWHTPLKRIIRSARIVCGPGGSTASPTASAVAWCERG